MVAGLLSGLRHADHVKRSEHYAALHFHRRPEVGDEDQIGHVDGRFQQGSSSEYLTESLVFHCTCPIQAWHRGLWHAHIIISIGKANVHLNQIDRSCVVICVRLVGSELSHELFWLLRWV